MSSFYFLQDELAFINHPFVSSLQMYSEKNKVQLYALKKPLGEGKYDYNINLAFAVLVPKHKIIFLNLGEETEVFDEYVEEFVEVTDFILKRHPISWKCTTGAAAT